MVGEKKRMASFGCCCSLCPSSRSSFKCFTTWLLACLVRVPFHSSFLSLFFIPFKSNWVFFGRNWDGNAKKCDGVLESFLNSFVWVIWYDDYGMSGFFGCSLGSTLRHTVIPCQRTKPTKALKKKLYSVYITWFFWSIVSCKNQNNNYHNNTPESITF